MNNKISIIVIRHGQSDANECGIISDKNIDHELTEVGIQEARKTAITLKNELFDLIVTSTRQRARLTAEIINEYHGLTIIERDDLIERDFGVLSGISLKAAQAKMTEDGFTWINIPEGEKAEEIDFRVKTFLNFLTDEYPNSKVLVSTHSDIVKSFHRILNGDKYSQIHRI